MKNNVLRLFLFICLLIACVGCEPSGVQRLRREVEAANKTLVNSSTSIHYDEIRNKVDMVNLVSDEELGELKKVPENLFRQRMILLFPKDAQSKKFLDLLLGADAGINFIYKSLFNGSYSVTIPSWTLKDMKRNPPSERELNEKILSNGLAIENAKGPSLIEPGMVQETVGDEGKNIVFLISLDENKHKLNNFSNSSVKEAMAESLAKDLDEFVSACCYFGKGICWRICGDKSDRCVDVVVSAEELRKILNS